MRYTTLLLMPVIATATMILGTLGIVTAAPAGADCNYSGGSTLCASGTVRGGSAPAYDPLPCSGDPLCQYYDTYDPFIVIGGGGIEWDRPNRPGGGGGGIRPR